MKKLVSFLAIAVAVVAATQAYYQRQARQAVSPAERQELRDAPADNSDLNGKDLKGVLSGLKESSNNSPAIQAGVVSNKKANDPQAGKPGVPVEWVSITGGKFKMGTDDIDYRDAKPIHEVAIKTFEMSKTPVTVEQYAECVNQGQCTEPRGNDYCNWGKTGRQLHPVNCVNWEQANQYAKFKGARLPSESEWEYAARSAGKDRKYPWGDEEATCERAVISQGGDGCGKNSTWPVCSKPQGNTEQGLCDMAGNVWQWVQDRYQSSYANAPTEGSAFEASGSLRVLRGGSWNLDAKFARSAYRLPDDPGARDALLGLRLARSSR